MLVFPHWQARSLILIAWLHYGGGEPYRKRGVIFIVWPETATITPSSATGLSIVRLLPVEKILNQTALVNLHTVPTVANSALVEITPLIDCVRCGNAAATPCFFPRLLWCLMCSHPGSKVPKLPSSKQVFAQCKWQKGKSCDIMNTLWYWWRSNFDTKLWDKHPCTKIRQPKPFLTKRVTRAFINAGLADSGLCFTWAEWVVQKPLRQLI